VRVATVHVTEQVGQQQETTRHFCKQCVPLECDPTKSVLVAGLKSSAVAAFASGDLQKPSATQKEPLMPDDSTDKLVTKLNDSLQARAKEVDALLAEMEALTTAGDGGDPKGHSRKVVDLLMRIRELQATPIVKKEDPIARRKGLREAAEAIERRFDKLPDWKKGRIQFASPPSPSLRKADLLERAWGIIANAGGGDWDRETPDWKDAALGWRDEYHAWLGKTSKQTTSQPAPPKEVWHRVHTIRATPGSFGLSTRRFEVPGGWIYNIIRTRHHWGANGLNQEIIMSEQAVFVPAPREASP
jgi:hypothetical protein